jgi:hypothetical protein
MKTNIVIVNFSNRNDGNCSFIAHYLNDILNDSSVYEFGKMNVSNCGNCNYECLNGKSCIINDDLLLEKVYARLINKNNTYVYQLVKIPSVTNHLNKGDSLYAQHIYSLESTFSNRTGIISNLDFEKTLNAYWSLKPNT